MKYLQYLMIACLLMAQPTLAVQEENPEDNPVVNQWLTDFAPLKEYVSATGLNYHIQYVRTEMPTPLMTGYVEQDKSCVMVVNLSAHLDFSSLERRLILAHEVGHCEALRQGIQSISEPPTEIGEGLADVWALAWIAKQFPLEFDKAYETLVAMRRHSRKVSPIYSTFVPMRIAYARLRTEAVFDMNPTVFMMKMKTEY